jgi:hypothetical protein
MRTMIDLWAAVVRTVDVRDLIGLASVTAILMGVAQWSRPLAWVTGGAIGLAFWVAPHLRSRKGTA